MALSVGCMEAGKFLALSNNISQRSRKTGPTCNIYGLIFYHSYWIETMMRQSSFKPNGRILEKKDQFIRGFNVSDKAMRHLKKNKFFFFSFVRHPFERLVSSYMDKIIRLGDQWYKTVAPDMTNNRLLIKEYRKVARQWYLEDHSFSSYVDLVL